MTSCGGSACEVVQRLRRQRSQSVSARRRRSRGLSRPHRRRRPNRRRQVNSSGRVRRSRMKKSMRRPWKSRRRGQRGAPTQAAAGHMPLPMPPVAAPPLPHRLRYRLRHGRHRHSSRRTPRRTRRRWATRIAGTCVHDAHPRSATWKCLLGPASAQPPTSTRTRCSRHCTTSPTASQASQVSVLTAGTDPVRLPLPLPLSLSLPGTGWAKAAASWAASATSGMTRCVGPGWGLRSGSCMHCACASMAAYPEPACGTGRQEQHAHTCVSTQSRAAS